LDPKTGDATDESHGVGDFGKLQGKSFLLDDYFGHARDFHVKKIVHVTAAQAPPTWPDETRFLQELFEKHGHPHGIIGWTDFDRPPEEVDAELAAHAQYANFRGIRHQTAPRLQQRSRQRLPRAHAKSEGSSTTPSHTRTVFLPPPPRRSGTQACRSCWSTQDGRRGLDAMSSTHGGPGMTEFAAAENTAVKISGLGMPLRGFRRRTDRAVGGRDN